MTDRTTLTDDERSVWAVEFDEMGVPYGPSIRDDFVFSNREAAVEWMESEYSEGANTYYQVVEYPVVDRAERNSDEEQ